MPPKEKCIRLRSIHVFLTYADCDLPMADVLDQLNVKFRSMHNGIKKYIISHEIAPTTGLPHRHCWLRLARAPENILPSALHLDGSNKVYKGNYQSMKYEENCKDYVIKDGDILTDFTEDELAAIRNTVKVKFNKNEVGKKIIAGEQLKDLVKEYPALIFDYNKLKANIRSYTRDTADICTLETLDNEWIFGGTGAGKSREVHKRFPKKCKKTKDIYFNNYCGEDVLYFEDFDGSWGDVVWNMKEIADYYAFEAQCKLAEPMLIRPKKIVVTSNYTIREVYESYFRMRGIPCDNMLIAAIERRFKVTKIDSSPVNPDPLGIFPDDYFWNPDERLFLPDCDMDITYEKLFS